MKQLVIKINIDNSAYDLDTEEDIIRTAHRDLLNAINRHSDIIKDVNGNTIGSITIQGGRR